MTKRTAADVPFFLLGGQDILSRLTQFDDKLEAGLEEVHALGDQWRAQAFTGVRQADITQEGFYDDAANNIHDVLSSGPGISRVLCYGLEGTATGALFVGWEGAIQVNYERQISRGALHKARASYRNNGTVETGKIVRMWNTHAATGASTGTPIDNGVSATGGSGYLQWKSGTGETNVRILDSPDNITYSALMTFTKTVSQSHGAERLTTTGWIQRYVAMDVTTASATGKITEFQSFVGLYRGALTS